MSSGGTLVSYRGGRACGLPTPKGRLVTSICYPARSCARAAHSLKAGAEPFAPLFAQWGYLLRL
jgi:hypothetical protein